MVDRIGEQLGRHRRALIAVSFTHGDHYTQDDERRVATLGEAYLVSRLQALLQTKRVHPPANAESTALASELLNYEIKVDPDGNDKYGAFRTGTHDAVVTALGPGAVYAPGPSRRARTPRRGGLSYRQPSGCYSGKTAVFGGFMSNRAGCGRFAACRRRSRVPLILVVAT